MMLAEEVVHVPNITLSDVSLKANAQTIFANLNLHLTAGHWVGLVGASGVGKSSLLRTIAGLKLEAQMVSGCIEADNGLPVAQQIAYMAQTDLLLPWLSVQENIVLGLKLRREVNKKQLAVAVALLESVGLAKSLKYYPHQLSGGMRQRVALVRTLMEDKPVILMDEPFSALDVITRFKLHELAIQLLAGKTVLFITHDPGEALRLSQDIYLMHGSPASLEKITSLTSTTPRRLTDPDVLHWQPYLFQALAKASHQLCDRQEALCLAY